MTNNASLHQLRNNLPEISQMARCLEKAWLNISIPVRDVSSYHTSPPPW